jgi:hypothetical protein
MGGFSAQLQSPQSSAPASKGAGMSAMQMGQNPIQTPVLQKMEKSMDSQPNDGAIDPTQGMMGGQITMPGQGGQPQLGMPNAYSNTVSPWDNSVNQPKQGSGKGKGA